tara:strand:+ start:5289 stop:5996 length:708 start_codon:yes stop_codon:yes gene_type:complete
MKIGLVLTQWKRNNLKYQLDSIYKQTLIPHYIVVFQNENHVDISDLKKQYDFIHVKSDYNTKYFGRFSYFFTLPVDICIVMDDDIIPGKNCIKNYIEQCIRKDGIIGGNGRIGYFSPYRNIVKQPCDVGVRNNTEQVDFVGHMWVFKKKCLYHMFGTKPFTYDTSEDMHLCFSNKVYGKINSYTAKQLTVDDMCDIAYNKLADDAFSSFKTTKTSLRENVEKYWIEKGLKHIKEN